MGGGGGGAGSVPPQSPAAHFATIKSIPSIAATWFYSKTIAFYCPLVLDPLPTPHPPPLHIHRLIIGRREKLVSLQIPFQNLAGPHTELHNPSTSPPPNSRAIKRCYTCPLPQLPWTPFFGTPCNSPSHILPNTFNMSHNYGVRRIFFQGGGGVLTLHACHDAAPGLKKSL